MAPKNIIHGNNVLEKLNLKNPLMTWRFRGDPHFFYLTLRWRSTFITRQRLNRFFFDIFMDLFLRDEGKGNGGLKHANWRCFFLWYVLNSEYISWHLPGIVLARWGMCWWFLVPHFKRLYKQIINKKTSQNFQKTLLAHFGDQKYFNFTLRKFNSEFTLEKLPDPNRKGWSSRFSRASC